MKRFIIILMGLITSVVFAAGNEQIQLISGAMTMIDVPFAIKACSVSNQEVAKVSVLSEKQMQVVGGQAGSADIMVSGETGNIFYTVTVTGDIRGLYRELSADLDFLPELEITPSGSKVVVKGEISSIPKLDLYQKVLNFYQGSVLNLVVFRPKPEVMKQLQSTLEQAGYVMVKEGAVFTPGDLLIKSVGDTVVVSGKVYSPQDVNKIKDILDSQSWLSTSSSDSRKVRALLNIEVAPEMLELGAVYVGLDKTQLEQIGMNFMEAGIPITFSAGYGGRIDRRFDFHRGGGGYSLGTNLNTVINLLGHNTNSVFRHAGFLSFSSKDQDTARSLHNGGTLKVRLNGTEQGALESVGYGFTLTVKGGLTGKDTVTMEIEVTMSSPVLMENDDYDLKSSTIKTIVVCKLNETVALGGLKELLQNNGGPDGMPYLRHLPIINWFVAEKEVSYQDKEFLMLISPQLMTQAKPIELPPSQELRDVDENAVEDLLAGKRKQRRWFRWLRW
jgi:Flp pilus assembly secretin CpaC